MPSCLSKRCDIIPAIFELPARSRGRLVFTSDTGTTRLGRADRTGYEPATTIWADIVQMRLDAIPAERALVTANHSVRRIHRQILVAIFAIGPQFEHGTVPKWLLAPQWLQLTIKPAPIRQSGETMLFMIIERFEGDDMIPIYRRLEAEGRQLPVGLTYVDSWIEANFSRCFQLMECEDAALLQEWVLSWRGTGARFEIVPVVPSSKTREVVAPHMHASAHSP